MTVLDFLLLLFVMSYYAYLVLSRLDRIERLLIQLSKPPENERPNDE